MINCTLCIKGTYSYALGEEHMKDFSFEIHTRDYSKTKMCLTDYGKVVLRVAL